MKKNIKKIFSIGLLLIAFRFAAGQTQGLKTVLTADSLASGNNKMIEFHAH